MNDVCCVMISIPQRDQVRQRTLMQLRPLGFEARVFMHPELPLGPRNHYAAAVDALRFGLASGRPYVLFLEDDLDISRRFPAAVAESVQAGAPVVTFYCAGYRFYPAELKRALKQGRPYAPGLYPVAWRCLYFGSQALLLSREFVVQVLDGWRKGYLDNRIARIAPASMRLYAPNPVQHYGACLPSTWGVFLAWSHSSASFQG